MTRSEALAVFDKVKGKTVVLTDARGSSQLYNKCYEFMIVATETGEDWALLCGSDKVYLGAIDDDGARISATQTLTQQVYP